MQRLTTEGFLDKNTTHKNQILASIAILSKTHAE
jgi:hypothetical protein